MRLLTLAVLLLGFNCPSLLAEESPKPTDKLPANVVSGKVLQGSWVRPDGGYVLQINAVEDDGTLKAAYLNPRPLREASARWRVGGNRLQIRIDLNDTGYEGSFYLLQYHVKSGKLEGEYTPAGQGVFPVTFERQLGPLAR